MDKLHQVFLSNGYNLYGIVNGIYELRLEELEEVCYVRKYDKKEVSGISKSIFSDIKTGRARPALNTIITFCIFCELEPQYSLIVIEAAGYKLTLTYDIDRAYMKLIQEHYYDGIEEANRLLEEWKFDKKYYLLDYNK